MTETIMQEPQAGQVEVNRSTTNFNSITMPDHDADKMREILIRARDEFGFNFCRSSWDSDVGIQLDSERELVEQPVRSITVGQKTLTFIGEDNEHLYQTLSEQLPELGIEFDSAETIEKTWTTREPLGWFQLDDGFFWDEDIGVPSAIADLLSHADSLGETISFDIQLYRVRCNEHIYGWEENDDNNAWDRCYMLQVNLTGSKPELIADGYPLADKAKRFIMDMFLSDEDRQSKYFSSGCHSDLTAVRSLTCNTSWARD